MRQLVMACVVAGVAVSSAFAQGGKKFKDVVPTVKATVEPTEAKRGETVTWKLTVEVIPGWHTYPTKQTDPNAESFVNKITFPKPGDVIFVDQLQEPANGIKQPDKDLDIKEYTVYEGKVTWTRKFVVSPNAKPGKLTIKVPVKVLACDKSCIDGKVDVEVDLTVSDKPAVAVDPKFAAEVAKKDAPATPEKKAEPKPATPAPKGAAPLAADEQDDVAPSADQKAALAAIIPLLDLNGTPPSGGLTEFLLQAMAWGAITLLTPCVFPMIPITVSFFLKQSEQKHVNPLAHALVYCAVIVVVLGVAALTLLGTFRSISNHWLTNYLIGGLLVAMALSLFGLFELTLPTSLTRFTSERESKGGLVGTVFMALTFTIVSFTCVAPFLGGFAGMAASGKYPYWQLAAGAFAFSATFAAPFFLLALFPSMLKRLPRSGGWLNSVKVVMGFLELAAAVKFFRTGELSITSEPNFFTYDLALGMIIALAFLCGFYLVNVFRVGHDAPLESIGVVRLMTGFAFLSLGIYLLPGMFAGGADGERHRPSGVVFAWVDAFLLPDHSGGGGLHWTGDLKQALEESRRAQRSGRDQFIFVDFTGTNCQNCRLNERNVFTKPQIKELFRPYKLVQLYTDKVPEDLYAAGLREKLNGTSRQWADGAANNWFQREAFGSEQLPLYVILKPNDARVEVVGIYDEGKINDVAAFEEFLRKPIAASGARASLK